jgi:chemotaxis protein MotB
MTLALEAERRKAEETLTLLAAAEAAREELEGTSETALTEAQRRAAELAQANILLAEQREVSAEGQRQVALLNQQTASLRAQLDELQGLLDASEVKDAAAQVQIERLGQNLNAALARVAVEERRRAELDAAERERLAAEALDLQRYRSEFFGRMREILGEREGVQVVGDRFVFPSEVLFAPGSATLNAEGRVQVSRVASVIREIADDIPEGIDWVLRVDGHTDRTPVSATSPFDDNWELSQARALSVVRYMIEAEGLPADRLAATGFGEHRPIDSGGSPEAFARNRRIELKFTER